MPKQKLVEHFYRDWPDANVKETKLALNESNQIVEYAGKRYEARGALTVPVWRLEQKNLNGRIYGRDLAEKVIANNVATVCLADHPKEEGSVKDIMAVAKNPRIMGDIMYADCYFVDDDFAQKVYRIVELGSAVGVSSSAFGDVDASGRVMADGFELERYFDFVLNPSYQVFIDKKVVTGKNVLEFEEGEEEMEIEIEEATKSQDPKTVLKEGVDNSEIQKLREKNIESRIRRMFESARSADTIAEKVSRYKEILEYCAKTEGTDQYVDEVDVALEEIEAETNELQTNYEDMETAVVEVAKQTAEQEVVTEKVKKQVKKVIAEKKVFENGLLAVAEEVVIREDEVKKLKRKMAFAEKFLNDARIREERFQKIVKSLKEENKKKVSESEFSELKAFAESVMEENKKLKESKVKMKIELQEMEGLLKKSIASNKKLKEMRLYDDDEIEIEEEEDSGDDIGSSGEFEPIYMESVPTKKIRFMNEQVLSWYNDKKKLTPGITQIQGDLARCRNMREAYKVFYAQEDLLEVSGKKNRVVESVLDPVHPSKFEETSKASYGISDVSINTIKQRPGWG